LGEHNLTIPGFAYPGGKVRIATALQLHAKEAANLCRAFAGRANGFWKAATTLQLSNWLVERPAPLPNSSCILSHGNTIHFPAHEESIRAVQGWYKSGDPSSILLIPYSLTTVPGFDALL